METRTIAIANNKTQRRYSIETNATTLGELKAQMTQQGIDYAGMTFTEGITKTQLLTDDSLLPTNVMYRGQATNNLVMLLTNPNKQIASGAVPTDRKLFGTYIKSNNLGNAIKAEFGDNWTRISTDKLVAFFKKNEPSETEDLSKVRKELSNIKEVKPESSLPDVKEAPHANIVNWFYDGIKDMAKNNLLYTEDIIVLAALTTELSHRLWEAKPRITDDDIDNMIASIY